MVKKLFMGHLLLMLTMEANSMVLTVLDLLVLSGATAASARCPLLPEDLG